MNALKISLLCKRVGMGVSIFLLALQFLRPVSAGLESGADFLKIPIGAEPAGLGEAYTALAHGINALTWNPAGILITPPLTNTPSLGVSLSHQDQLSENNLDHLGLVVPARGSLRNSWGVDIIRLSYAEQARRDLNRQPIGTFGASDLAFGAALAHDFGRFQAGTQLKMIRQELDSFHADGFAIDLGLLSETPNPQLSVGISVQNIGPKMQFIHETYNLPLTVSFGTAYRLASPFTLACDIHIKPYQKQTIVSLGTEIGATRNVTLRAGYLAKIAETIQNRQQSETNLGNFAGLGGLAAGIGLQFRQFNVDYSITPFGELSNVQMLTLSTWFGEHETEKSAFQTPSDSTTSAPSSNRVILILPTTNESWWDHLGTTHPQP